MGGQSGKVTGHKEHRGSTSEEEGAKEQQEQEVRPQSQALSSLSNACRKAKWTRHAREQGR